MHNIEPFENWVEYYEPGDDENSPFHGREYQVMEYTNDIYGYYIHPYWDHFGSETLYLKMLYADYDEGWCVLEMFGEWNDAINNDIMHLKRHVLDELLAAGLNKFILLGDHVLNFHGSDDSYYEEWFEDVEDGWLAAVNLRDHVIDEMELFNIDSYINMGGSLTIENWRTLTPRQFYQQVNGLIVRRLGS